MYRLPFFSVISNQEGTESGIFHPERDRQLDVSSDEVTYFGGDSKPKPFTRTLGY
jgi:hypothetical protein